MAVIIFLLVTFACNAVAFNPQFHLPKVNFKTSQLAKDLSQKVTAAALSTILLTNTLLPTLPGGEALAESRLVGEIAGSGIFFKDTLNVESFDDPKVKGVTLYISNFQRPLNERLTKDFFSDPSFAAVACAKTGPVAIADNIATGKGGEEVFEENRSLLFKQLRVQRIYDKEKNTVIYVSFNTRLDKNSDENKSRFKSSVCAVNLD
jgi:catabolite regulation protein CreA